MAHEIGQVIEVTAHEIDRFGQGVSRLDDVVVFTHGLLKDEKALVIITKVKRNFIESKIKKILITSPLRKTSPSQLGSLDLYHLNDESQNEWQYQVTQTTLLRNIGYNGPIEPVISSVKTLNYRNKVVYHVLNNPLMRLGLFTKEPIELREVHTFILNSLAIQRCISKIQQQSIIVDPEIFKHIVLRSNEKEEVLVTLVAYQETFVGLNELVNIIKSFKEVIGITLNIKPNEKTILGKQSILLYGKNEINFNLGHLKLKLNDRSFMQVNSEVMLKTYEQIANAIKFDTVVDCYSGIGSIGYFIGNLVKKVIMIENNHENILMAKEIKMFHKGNYEIFLGNVESILPKLKSEVVIFDPPRTGLHASLLEMVKEKKYLQIIYLSCELNTLVRDLKSLSETYHITKVYPVRMFPQTTSIETLVVLDLK